MRLNRFGEILQSVCEELSTHYPGVSLEPFIVMPNHLHCVVKIERENSQLKIAGLGEVVRALKTFSARRCNEIRRMPGESVWQRNYYDHVIRNEKELNQIGDYIEANPSRWAEDENNLDGETGRVSDPPLRYP